MLTPDQLGPAESRLRDAVRDGLELDLCVGDEALDDPAGGHSWGPERQIRGEVLAAVAVADGQQACDVPRFMVLRGARITGPLWLKYSRVDIALLLEGCYFECVPDLRHAQVHSLSLAGSHVPGIEAYSLQVDGDLDLGGVTAARVCLFGAHIAGRFWLNGATLRSSDGYALDAPDINVLGGVYGGYEVVVEGGINLYGATIGAGLELSQAHIVRTRPGPALRADCLATGADLSCRGAQIAGGASFFGARVGGQMWFNSLTLTCSDGWALSAPNASVQGGIYARGGLTAHGGINLYAITVGDGIELRGARLTPDCSRHALRASHAKVTGNIDCSDGFVAGGDVTLASAVIEGCASFQSSEFDGSRPTLLDLTNAQVGELRLDDLVSAPGSLLLAGARFRKLLDDPECQPRVLDLDRAQYDVLLPQRSARERIKWLETGNSNYRPWRYEQLSAYYRRLGHEEDARTVQLAKQRRRRAQLHLPGRLWGWLQDGAVGYGYRPTRAFAWLALAIGSTTSFFALVPPEPSKAGHGPSFSALAYAVDMVLPVLDLGQQRAFTPQGLGQWVEWASILSGWLLATTVISGVTRALTRR